jgi:hypothetical protein
MKKLLGRILAFALMSELIAIFCYGGWIRWVLVTAILLPGETSGAAEQLRLRALSPHAIPRQNPCPGGMIADNATRQHNRRDFPTE